MGEARDGARAGGTRLVGRPRLPPATVKVAVTGRGAASKEQVGRVLAALLPGMPRIEAGSPLDRTDALAVAWCHLQRRKRAAVEDRLAQAARRR